MYLIRSRHGALHPLTLERLYVGGRGFVYEWTNRDLNVSYSGEALKRLLEDGTAVEVPGDGDNPNEREELADPYPVDQYFADMETFTGCSF